MSVSLKTRIHNFAVSAKYDFDSYSGLNIPLKIVEDLVTKWVETEEDDGWWKDEIEKYYANASEYGLDTYPRDWVLDKIVKMFMGEDRHWPLNHENVDMIKFHEELKSAMEKKGE